MSEQLSSLLNTMPPAAVRWVAFSGGCDSTVLLHLAALARDRAETAGTGWQLRAIHVNHGLQANALDWEAHCLSVCEALAVPLDIARPNIARHTGNLEARARSARYAVFRELLQEDDLLLMAHHLEDQLESMLLALMRGRGPAAVAGMPATRRLGRGNLWRPLLQVHPGQLKRWAESHQLRWIEDPSNARIEHDRNYLRHRVLPTIRSRWPGFASGWQQSANLIAEAAEAQQREAVKDLAWVGDRPLPDNPKLSARAANRQLFNGQHLAAREYTQRLSVEDLLVLDPARRRNLIRHWLRALCRLSGDAAPDGQLLARIDTELLVAAQDATPLLEWAGSYWQLRRFRGCLYACLPAPVPVSTIKLPGTQTLYLGGGLGTLRAVPGEGKGVPARFLDSLHVRFAQRGLTAKPAGRRSRSLKKLFQAYAVPPWLRDKVPLIYSGDELVAVADLFICDGWQVEEAEVCKFSWIRSELHCGY